MADVNYYLRDTTAQKETGVMLFFSYNGKRLKIATLEKINPKYWNSKNQRAKQTTSFPTHSHFNTRLEMNNTICLNAYRKFLNDNNQEQPSPQQIKDLLKANLNPSEAIETKAQFDLIGFTELFIKESETGKRLTDKGTPVQIGTIKIYRTLKKNLITFKDEKKYNLNLENIGLAFFEDFKDFMTFEIRYTTNTLAKHVRTLKTIINDAIERGLTTVPFRGKRYNAKTEQTTTIYLSKLELKTIYDLDLSKNSRLDRVRDLFMVGCWTGLRFSDYNNISQKNIIGDYFEIKTQKTGKGVVIPIHPYVKEIMNKYEGKTENSLPQTISNQKMNEYLKEIGELAGIDETITLEFTKGGQKVLKNVPKHSLLSSHTARRSFATNMYLDNFPSISIMAITGHTTESSFMKYIRVTPKEHAEKLRELWQRQTLSLVI